MQAHYEMLRQLRNRDAATSLPQRFYGDEAFHRLDLETLFYREWLFVGHDCELPRKGSYLTLQVGDYPILVLNDGAGRIRAFHNTCRHRGSRLCRAAKGMSKKLVCPYHGWTYELDGRLFAARDPAPGMDHAAHGLKPVHCESAGGYLFVCLAPVAPDFAALRAKLESYFGPHRLRDAKVAHETSIVENGNWKLVWENNRECYHCRGNHPELCRTFPETPTITGVRGAENNPEIVRHWERCEAAGLPSRFHLADDGQYRLTRLPLLGQAESFTLSGEVAVRRPLGDLETRQPGSLLLFHYPTTWNHVLRDHAVSFRVLPLGPRQTQVTTKWLVHKDAVEGVDYDLESLTHVWTRTNDQDRRVVEENQIGVASPAYEPGPYSPVQEDGVIQFVAWYCRFMERGLLGGAGDERLAGGALGRVA